MALDGVAESAGAADIVMFARLYSKHRRAADMSFPELLRLGASADMAATAALDAWTVWNPFLLTDACGARDQKPMSECHRRVLGVNSFFSFADLLLSFAAAGWAGGGAAKASRLGQHGNTAGRASG